MKTATNNLERDHEYIIKLIEVMEVMTRDEKTEIEHIQMVVDLIRNYADGLHHAKEENMLFPMMGEKGFPVQGGPVGVMLMEHEQGRTYVRGMADNIEAYKNDSMAARQKIYDNMLGYTNLLRNHIYKENNILFKMVDNAFTEQEQAELLEKFEKVEAEYSAGKLNDFIKIINELSDKYSG